MSHLHLQIEGLWCNNHSFYTSRALTPDANIALQGAATALWKLGLLSQELSQSPQFIWQDPLVLYEMFAHFIRKMIPAVLVGQGSVSQLFFFLQLWHLQAAALGRWGRSRTTSPAGKPQPKHQTPAAASQAVEHELPSFATQGTGVTWLQFQQSLVYQAIIHGSLAAATWLAEPSLQKVLGVFPTVWK